MSKTDETEGETCIFNGKDSTSGGGNDRMAQPTQNSPAFILPLICPSKNKFLGKCKALGSSQYNRSCLAFQAR